MAAAYLSFMRPVNVDTCNALLQACNAVVQQGGITEIHILFSSAGGQLIPGFGVYNQLLGFPLPIITHNIGSVNSIANAMFLAGSRRIASPATTFLLHGTAWEFGAGTTVTLRQLSEIAEGLKADEDRLTQIFVARTIISRKEIENLMGQGVTRDAAFALSKGIIHEIADVSIPAGSVVHQV